MFCRYCGLEKDTVILKKVSTDDSVPLHRCVIYFDEICYTYIKSLIAFSININVSIINRLIIIIINSYIGKGMVSYPPKLVYEVLRSPTRRVAYDDMVKVGLSCSIV